MENYNIDFRKCKKNDDITLIAKYIYLTDPYIYPSISKSPDDLFFQKLILNCFKDITNLFYYENLFLAICDEKIIGILCAIKAGEKKTFLENISITDKEKEQISISNNGYFIPLIKENLELKGFNITNVCIDPYFRSKGIGENLIRFYLNQIDDAPIHLDVIANNSTAIHLYQKCGFKIENEYNGFSGTDEPLLCYHMIKK